MTGSRPSPFTSVRFARKRRTSPWHRRVLVTAAGLALLALAVTLGLWRYANARIDRIDLPSLDQPPGGSDSAVEGTLNVLLVGNDSREGLTYEELELLGTEAVDGKRTDTIMILQMSPARERAVMLSFPRDLRVAIPGFGTGKINGVYSHGGPDLLVQTIQAHTGIDLDHFVEVDLAGFLRLADAVGGVEVCLDEPIDDVASDGQNYTGLDLPAGCQVLDKIAAARFVRARHSSSEQFGDDDFGRIARQQYFIKRAMQKVTSAGTLLNPFKVKSLVDVVASTVRTDRDLGATTMLRLANGLKGITADDLELRMVPSYAGPSFVYEYPEQAEALYQALRLGTGLPPVGTTLPEELGADDVRVEIQNGAGIDGLASAVETRLRTSGYDVVAVGNADSFEHTSTILEYAPDRRQHAELLSEAFPGAELREVDDLPDGIDVRVIVGTDQADP